MGTQANEASLDEVEMVGDAARISSLLADRATVQRVLDDLPDHYGQAVVLRDLEQLDYDVITRRLGISINTARSRLARGRALAAAKLAEG